MNSRLIHENFRRFLLNENIDPNDVCMYHQNPGAEVQRIILYKPLEDAKIKSRLFLDTVIVGAVLLKSSDLAVREPCIPKTFQVSSIHTHKDYEGEGFQKLLMDCAFYYLGQRNEGLTSDQASGTKKKAGKAWDKIEKSSEYEKRKTPEGNDEFDYYDQTPDPDDDCYKPDSNLATSHSFQKKNTSNIQPQYERMKENHKKYLKKIDRSNRGAFKNMLVLRSRDDFIRRYSGF